MLTPPTYTAAAAMSPLSPSHSLPLPPTHRYAFLARSQERRYLLCPLCRSLAVCQTEPMPIQGMSNGLKILHSLCFLLFPMANKSREGLNQREKPGHMPCVQQDVQHPQSCSLIRDKNIFFWDGSILYRFHRDPLCLPTVGSVIIWTDGHSAIINQEMIPRL